MSPILRPSFLVLYPQAVSKLLYNIHFHFICPFTSYNLYAFTSSLLPAILPIVILLLLILFWSPLVGEFTTGRWPFASAWGLGFELSLELGLRLRKELNAEC